MKSPEGDTTVRPPPSDALVFFGATGDLAYKKIFPALFAMLSDIAQLHARHFLVDDREGAGPCASASPAGTASRLATTNVVRQLGIGHLRPVSGATQDTGKMPAT